MSGTVRGSDDDKLALEHYARTRDPETRDRLIERFQGLAIFHARRFTNRGIERDDLEQVAMIGLLNALDRYDPDRQVELSTFASRTIEGELKRHFRDKGWAVRVPRGLRDLSVTVRRTSDDLETELGRPAKPDEIAARLGIDTGTVLEALDASAAFRTAPLEAPNRAGSEQSPAALGQVDVGFSAVADRLVVEQLLETLPERECTIVAMRFYDRLTQSEIAERVGISQMHVSRLLRRSLLQLRKELAP
jgi:RNA polymerase sigma-B factor